MDAPMPSGPRLGRGREGEFWAERAWRRRRRGAAARSARAGREGRERLVGFGFGVE
jgi:hypothetical protein